MIERAERQREAAREIFLRTLQTTTVAAAIERSVRCDGNTLHVAGRMYDLALYSEICIVSIGKAGATMFDAIDPLLSRALPGDLLRRSAIVSAPVPPQRLDDRVLYFRGGHPEPNASSIAAARTALDAVSEAADDALILFLISGGASAMCELPLSDTVSLENLVQLNRVLVGSGASITEINSVRKHLSRVKGGRLAAHAGTRDKITLLVSDVPDNALDALGSGPSLPDTSTVADCLNVLSRYMLWERLPLSIQRCIENGLEESPKQGDPVFRNAVATVLLNNATFLEQAKRNAEAMGYIVEVDLTCDDWDYRDAATYLLGKLHSLQQPGKKICLLAGGEVTVRLPENPGIGGRNMQFCLHCAATGLGPGITVFSAGTDGVDGNSQAAGAVVDATTRPRGEQIGLGLDDFLNDFNAYNYLAPLGYVIMTGPTGNNLRDIRILLWESIGS
jgi:hydroxypyruvate reductase